ncbi:C-type lectin-related protein 2 precursor, partial [Biomphalaria glabrata]
NVLCNAGFHKITDGQISACVWVSNVSMNYIQARDDCKEKGAHLLTLKTQEKFTLLHKNDPGRYLWIGLTDRLIEDIFKWDDDNSICNPLCRGRLFST